jgi:hypothetical protein
MKKSIVISSLLLAGVGCSVEHGQDDLTDVQSEAIAARADLKNEVFVSKKVYAVSHYKWDMAAHKASEVQAQVRLRLTFVPAEGYTLDGKPKGLDYEVIVEEVEEGTGDVFPSDMTYFVRRKSKQLHYFYDCDSTRTCENQDGGGRARIYVYDLANGKKGLTLKQEGGVTLLDSTTGDIELVSR